MRKLILLLSLLPLWGLGGCLFAAVQVKSISADYANKRVTFSISWVAGSRDATHLSKVWVFVDYQEVTNPNTTGAWQRASIDLSALPAGGSADGANTKGFWYQGQATAAQSATITVTLTNVPAKFNWCAYATDYPPNAAVYNNGTYTLKGMQPFIVNGAAIAGNKFTGTVNSLTDATGCPGWIERDVATASGTCRAGLTLVGGYCRDLVADNATIVVGIDAEVKLALGGNCTANGWRYPTQSEAVKLHSAGYYVHSISNDGNYWVRCVHYAANCSYCTGNINGYCCNYLSSCGTWQVCYNDNSSRCIR